MAAKGGDSVRPVVSLPLWTIAIAASAGGLRPLRSILAALPPDFPAAIIVVVHRTPGPEDGLLDVLGRSCDMPVSMAAAGESLEGGHVYLARSDCHLQLTENRRFVYVDGPRIKFVRSSANPLLESAAKVMTGRVIAVVLSGTGSDAADGVQFVKAHGGLVIAQDRASSEFWNMPHAAIDTGVVDYVLPVGDIAGVLTSVVQGGASAAPIR